VSTAGGAVVLVATPIGNLGDLSPRAVEVLTVADVICCEDTRRTRALLSAAGIRAGGRLRSLHAHNEASRQGEVVAAASAGKTVAVVSDAGTPGISDPGAKLVAAAAGAGVCVTVVPGPSAVLAALVVSGLPADRFCVEGFLPRKGPDRRHRLEAIVAERRTSVVLESPLRLAGTLAELAEHAPGRAVAVCRELTKVHEEVWRGDAAGAAEVFSSRQVKGEVVLVVGGLPAADSAAEPDDAALASAMAARMVQGDSLRDAAGTVSGRFGVSRRRAYAAGLAARQGEAPP
jgi:16S rRNA (cytidine1402-2'-O)-methyltransferase